LHASATSDALRQALRGVDRLVLLGDTLELRQGPLRDALAVASRVLPGLAAALGPSGEIVIVPGNHDHQLLAPWFARRAQLAPPPLGLQAEVQWAAGEPLAVLAGALSPAAVRVCYPGVWLRDDVYATHGHYGDLHSTVPMFERLGAGAMSRMLGVEQTRTPEDYEAVLAPIYAWIDAVAQAGGPEAGGSGGLSTKVWRSLSDDGDDGERERVRGGAGAAAGLGPPGSRIRAQLRRRGLAAGLGAAVALLNRAGLGPLRAGLSGVELRRAGLLAFATALSTLRVESDHVIFGHTHRAGPLPGDETAEWIGLTGARLLNSGCWVHEPAFLGREPLRSPYRGGFCVQLDDSGPPRLVNLLDAFPRDGVGPAPSPA
jgi:hypothetical protein